MKYDEIKNQEEFDKFTETEDGEHFCDSNFAYSFFYLDDGSTPVWNSAMYDGAVFDLPYWIDNVNDDTDIDKYYCQYVLGSHDSWEIGTTDTIDGIEYKYIDSQLLSEEMEHQLKDGTLVYEYRGSSFLRILEKV